MRSPISTAEQIRSGLGSSAGEAEHVFLRGLGCDMAQGFYFGRPMADSALVSLLDARRASSADATSGNVVRLAR